MGPMYPCPCYHQSKSDEENLQVGRNLKNAHIFFQKNGKYKEISRGD